MAPAEERAQGSRAQRWSDTSYGRSVYIFAIVVVALALLPVLALVVYGRLVVRNQRKALLALRRNGLAYLCRPTMGMFRLAGFILSVDQEAVCLWKVGLGRPVQKQTFPGRGATVAPTTVKINVARRSPGLSVTSSTGERADVVIYPDPTLSYSAPVEGPLLEVVCDDVRRELAHSRGV